MHEMSEACLFYRWVWLHEAVTKRLAGWAGIAPRACSLQLSFLAAYPALSALFYLRASILTYLSFYPVRATVAIQIAVVCLSHEVVLRQATTYSASALSDTISTIASFALSRLCLD
jgi:hypothetical protein